jgi:hypothetical protein
VGKEFDNRLMRGFTFWRKTCLKCLEIVSSFLAKFEFFTLQFSCSGVVQQQIDFLEAKLGIVQAQVQQNPFEARSQIGRRRYGQESATRLQEVFLTFSRS